MDVKSNISTERVQLDRIRPVGHKRIDPDKGHPNRQEARKREKGESKSDEKSALGNVPQADDTSALPGEPVVEEHILDVRV